MTEKEQAFELIVKFREADLEGMIFTADVNPEREERAPYDVPLKFYFESRFKVYDGKLIEQIPSFNVFF